MATSSHQATDTLSWSDTSSFSQLGSHVDSQLLEPYLLKGAKQTSACKRLGCGSFGVVDELYFQGTLCAVKELHSPLVDPRMEGVERVISRFLKECGIMEGIRHPNIVQFLGLHYRRSDSTYPTLVMERLAMSLENLLTDASKKKEDIPLSLKVSILSDTAKGLIYLHNHNPQIIHRDLTSRNILLTLAMQAKITDLGNALIIDSDTVAMTMTQTPGTVVYMPPEAVQVKARYDSSIDMFSYGHLTLYTVIQEFPKDLLPATYPEKDQLCARSEIQRREKYIGILHQKMGRHHQLTQIIESCLNNHPDKRPTAPQVLENLQLEDTLKIAKSFQDDYHDFQHASKLDLFKMLKSASSSSQYVITSLGPEPRKKEEYLQLVDKNSPTTTSTSTVLDRSEQIKIGVPGKLVLCKEGALRKRKDKKCDYTFKIITSGSTTSLVYYDEKIKGKVDVSSITDVQSSSQHDESNCFVITTKGKEGQLRLIASSKDEHDSWVKAIEQLMSSNIPREPLQTVVSAHELGSVAFSTLPSQRHHGLGSVAFSTLPSQRHFTTPESKRPHVPLNSTRKTKSAQMLKPHVSWQDHPEYDYDDIVLDTNICYSVSPLPRKSHHGGSPAMVNPKSVSIDSSPQEEGGRQIQSAADDSQSMRSVSDPSPERSKDVSKLSERLSRLLNPDQMEYLIDMLIQGKNSLAPQHESAPIGTTPPLRPPKPAQQHSSTPEFSSLLAKFQEHPSQLSLSTAEEKESGGKRAKKGKKRVPPPPPLQLAVEPPDKGSPLLEKRRKSTGMLNVQTPTSVVKFKLARLLSDIDADRTSQTSLLVTDDSSGASEERPDWAKARRGSAPAIKIQSPPLNDDHLTVLRNKALFMERSDLQDLEEIGKGQFGKVYKARLVRGKSENMTVAVKTIKKYKSEQEMSDFIYEMGVMMDLMHPNIIHLYGIVQQEPPWLVLQYLPNRDLKNYLIKNKRSVDQLVKYMIDVAMGMHYIMERGLVHRDLAARNVMVDNKETCKVADFGLLREIPKDDTIYQATTELPWPIRWMAPESLVDREFSPATDVWSFGVVLWEMYYPNQLPYAEINNNLQVLSKILSGYRLPIPPEYPSIVAKIMKACWQKEPEKRPSFLLISQTLLM